jgi:hypothetical protein
MMNGTYQWSNNLLVPGYTNSQTMSGDSNAANWVTAWTGSTNTWIPTDSTVAARMTAQKWQAAAANNYKWINNPASPNIAGGSNGGATDGSDIGVNQNKLQDDLGWITNVRYGSVTSSGFTAYFHAPYATTGCYVGYGTNSSDASGWSKTSADSPTSQERTISVTGLTTKTTYYWQVWCPNSAPSAMQVLGTQ